VTVALVAARVLLAAVFAVAGVAKLTAVGRTAARVRLFGIPEAWARPLAVTIPVVELAIVGLVVPNATARIGGGLAAVVLLVFSGAIARLLVRGEAPDCHCFGALHSSRVGPGMLVRNLCLGACGIAVAAVPAAGIPIPATLWTAAVVVVALLTIAISRWRQRQQLRRRHAQAPAQRA
jgi:hypothetical protein